VIEGVSLVNNYRTQFSDILAKSSFEGLVTKLKEKAAE
jgi:phospholipid transport system substrate-binding protein